MEPETVKNKHQLLNRFSILFFHFCLFVFIVALAFPHNPAGNWYQQFMPSLPNFQVTDVTFLDSITGYAVTGNSSPNDSSGYILKTTNGGDNWILKYAEYRDFSRVKFINQNTGFVSGGFFDGARIYKTTNAGENWYELGIPGGGQIYFNDMQVLSEDTLWVVASNSLVGGVFRTTNGGANWQNQLSLGSSNPVKVYFYNGTTGYIAKNTTTSYVRRTTDGGASWSIIVNNEGFRDIYFADANTGWRAWGNNMYKTTNSGLNWITQILPFGGIIITTGIDEFTNINKDTIWGVGGWVQYPNFQSRGLLYRTIDGGNTWKFQVPDTAINIFRYLNNKFINKLSGWAYGGPTGIHTTNGGDTTFLVPVQQINSEVPKDFVLYQNYPNPFNATTKFKFQIPEKGYIQIKLYDITGRELYIITAGEYAAGVYEASFEANNFASGVYFYSLIIEGGLVDTKKMILIK